ncbi:hypothetical protein LSCM1_04332 [Leishmania martiniquensis]|uniref:RecA-like N-terminal domain-containing protein n=1 Tax=Leishmania martiniquensis TaxID=1580590 RepID=A0A836KEX4_9TRYP|nr:hypothetical protein LSCM1_04332 [Leishmania martiniquensis]
MGMVMPITHMRGDGGECEPSHLAALQLREAEGGEKERGCPMPSGGDSDTAPVDSLCSFSALHVLRDALAACCSYAPAFSPSTREDTRCASLLPGAPRSLPWRTEQAREALKTLIDLVMADIGVPSARHRQAESGEGFKSACPQPSVDALLLYLTEEGPSLREALRHHCCRLPRATPPNSATAHSQPGACGMAHTAFEEEEEALSALIRWTANAALSNRHLDGNLRKDGQGAPASGGRVLQTCTALSLLHSNLSFYQPLLAAPDNVAASPYTTAAAGPSTYWCSTGCLGLDQALGGGGFRSGWVTEVYGEAGAGKTQLMLQCLLQQAATDACHAAVALALADSASLTSLAPKVTAAGACGTNCPAARWREVFDRDAVEAVRCAVVYLVSEDVPTSRLGPLAAAAVRRAVGAVRLHPLINQLPSCIASAVWRCVESTCTVPMVLSRLQIRHIASVAEVLRLLQSPSHLQLALASRTACPTTTMPDRCQPPRSSNLVDAVRVLAGSQGRAVVVLDSVAAAVVAGQCDARGVAQDDASVTALGLRLRQAATTHNWCIIVANQVRAIPAAARQRQCALAPIKRARSPTTSSTVPAASSATRAVVPALGFSWASASHCRVLLRKTLSHGMRQLVLRHAPSHPPAQASYLIAEGGIEDA